MSAEVAERGSGHPVAHGLALVEQGVDTLLGASTWSLSDREVRDALTALTGLAARVEAARAVLVRESVARETPDARGERGARTVAALTTRGRVSPARARADVANAVVTCPVDGDLRGLGAAWAAGEVSVEHVDVARRCLKRRPRQVVRDRRDEVDALLTDHARQWDPGTADSLARHLLAVLAPDRDDRYDEHGLERRHVAVHTDSTGMVFVQGQLDPAGGLSFSATLDHLVEQDRATGGDVPGSDLRTRGQRHAGPAARAGRPGSRVRLARVLRTTGAVRGAPRHLVEPRRPHDHRQPRHAVFAAPLPGARRTGRWLDDGHARRPALVPAARTSRSRQGAVPQHPARHHRSHQEGRAPLDRVTRHRPARRRAAVVSPPEPGPRA